MSLSSSPSAACTAVLDDLTAIVDGDATAVARHADHLASCDACRDARHEATMVARAVGRAGADFVVPADLEARVLAAVDAAAPAASSPTVPVPAPAPAPTAPKARADAPAPTTSKPPAPVTAIASKRRTGRWVGAAALAAVAASATAYVATHESSSTTSGPTTSPTAQAGWSGKVSRVERAAKDGGTGLEARAAGATWQPVAADQQLAAGTSVRTDGRTRAWLALADGSQLALDHGTELTLASASAAGARRLELASGRVVADVAEAKDAAGPARIGTSRGTVEIVGTRLVVTASADQTAVRVTRGSVRLVPTSGDAVEVRAGEEGTLASTGATVAPAPALTSEVAWSESAEGPSDAGSTDLAGLGALRAFKPGESRDRDWGLTLARHDVKVRIAGPVARTEITETFRNDSDAVLEGVYQFPLPADARIDALALDVKDGFEEGAFIDKERATKIWTGVINKAAPRPERPPMEIIWVPGPWRDPALLDWKRGGRFELRVFPIPAKGQRTIKIAYTQVVNPRGGWRQYAYPLPHSSDGSTVAENFSVDVEVRGAEPGAVRTGGYDLAAPAPGNKPAGTDVVALAMQKTAFVPTGDLTIDYRPTDGAAELRAWTFAGAAAVAPDAALASKKGVGIDPKVVEAQRAIAADARPTAVLALRPTLPRWREGKARDYVLVVDTSQSMVGERQARALAMTRAAIDEMDRRDRVTVLACDSECRALGPVRAPSSQVAAEAATFLAKQDAAGASDLVGAIRAGAEQLAAGEREGWIIYIGDGFASTGFRRAADVEAAITAATAPRGLRVTTVAIGSDADGNLLAAAARGGGGSHLAWRPGQRVGTTALAVLETTYGAALRDAVIELPPGLADVAPAELPTIRAGEEVLIGARVTGDVRGDVVVRGTVGGQPFEQRYPLTLAVSTAAGNGFVPRLWASLAIDELERQGRGEDRARIVGLSQGYGVMSRHTSLLVLESAAMFQAFGVDRTRPQVAWTGEDDLEENTSSGAVAYAGGGSSGEAAGFDLAGGKADSARADKAKKAPSKDEDISLLEPLMEKSATSDRLGPMGASRSAPAPVQPRDEPWVQDGRIMVAMRKVWFRTAAIADGGPDVATTQAAIDGAETALNEQPDSRERHRALVQALAYGGELPRATEIARRWLERDRLDPEALGYLADLLGRQGQRDAALRTLAGLVDLAPDTAVHHERLASAYERDGRLRQSCAHRIALAALETGDARRGGAAVRCLRGLGLVADAELVLRGLRSDKLRVEAEKAATASAPPPRDGGDLTVRASWDAGADLDLTIVTPQGARLSWMGGRAGLVATDVRSATGEQLSLRTLPRGRYLVEVSRGADGANGPGRTIRGNLAVTALGDKRTLPFELVGDRAVVGRIDVTSQFRLEPVSTTVPTPTPTRLRPADIQRVWSGVAGQLAGCGDGTATTTRLTVRIEATGRARVTGGWTGRGAVDACLARVVQRLSFPASSQAVTVALPARM